MGTRHLTSVKIDGETKVAQYGQWDGYLSGQGQTIVDFLDKLTKSKSAMTKFRKNVRACRFISDDEHEAMLAEVGSEDGWMTMPQSDQFKEKHPELHRDTGADILNLILDAPRGLEDSSNFATDSLFCEYHYVVDLDKRKLEIYTFGVNHLATLPFKGIKRAFKALMKREKAEA